MEVSLRLQRSDTKAKGHYNYRIVAMPKHSPRQGRALEFLGYYNADKNPAVCSIKLDKLDKWIAKGAQMSQTVKDLVKKARKNA